MTKENYPSLISKRNKLKRLKPHIPKKKIIIQAGLMFSICKSESTKSSCRLLDLEPLKYSITDCTMEKDTLIIIDNNNNNNN